MVEISFEKLSRFERKDEPCAVAIPLATGVLSDPAGIALVDQGKSLPVQTAVSSRWPDGSVKWLNLDFQTELPGNAGKRLTLGFEGGKPVEPAQSVQVTPSNGGLLIETGELTAGLNGPGESGIFGAVNGEGFNFPKGSLKGPAIYDAAGEWIAVIDERGWQILKGGPLVVSVKAGGKHHHRTGKSLLDFEIEITAFAGKPWLQVDYRIIHRETAPEIQLTGMELSYVHDPQENMEIGTRLATSNYRSFIQTGDGEQTLQKTIDAEYMLYDMNEHIPETFYGTFWADWRQPQVGGLCLTLYQAYQNFPKSLAVGKAGLVAGILPQGSSLILLQGMAKTHRMFLHFHGTDTPESELNVRSLQFQLPDRGALQPEVYKCAGVLEDVFVSKPVDWVERSLVNMADNRARAYGILAWGDAPDLGYTEQGRGKGRLVWTNNEYDFPHAAMLMYVKTGERRFMDYVLVAAQHLMDVDVCHYHEDPLRYQGQITHSAWHVTGKVSPCHEWVEGLLDFYHLTADNRALETAIGIGENVIRLLAQPRYHAEGGINARETGWALRSLVALYRETHDEKWLEPAEMIVEHFETWKATYGGWLSPYTDHTVVRVPFMIAVAVNSLMRYYRVRPQERIKTMIIDAVTDLVDNCLQDNGVFYYKELPSLRRNGTNTLILEALAYAYEFTGEKHFLQVGLATFNLAMRSSGGYSGYKQIREDAVLFGSSDGPKRFAQAFYALAYYYRTAVQAGVVG